MAQNTSPIFVNVPSTQTNTTGTTANTALDGSGTITTVFTADATDGSKIDKVYLRHLGTNVATVVRFFVDRTGSGSFKLIHEETMAANTLSQTAASVPVVWVADLALQAGGKLGVTIGTSIASGIQVTAVGGDY
jgi:hypothetical protein